MIIDDKHKYASIRYGAIVYIDGKYMEWWDKYKLLRVDSVIRKRTRMKLTGNWYNSEKTVLAYFDDLTFTKPSVVRLEN